MHLFKVPLYFAKHIYVYFILGMHPDYTSTPSRFYGDGGRRIHARPRARGDPGAQPEVEPLVGHPNRTFLRTHDVFESYQLAIEEQSALEEATRMTMHGTMMVV